MSDALLAIGSFIFALVAGWFLYIGFVADVSVPTDSGDVANLQLMHVQATNIAVGIGAALVSAVLAVGSAIVAAIHRAASPGSGSI